MIMANEEPAGSEAVTQLQPAISHADYRKVYNLNKRYQLGFPPFFSFPLFDAVNIHFIGPGTQQALRG